MQILSVGLLRGHEMKRTAFVLALALAMGVATGCSGKKETAEKPGEALTQSAQAPVADKIEGAVVKDSPVAEKAAAQKAFIKIEKVETAKAALNAGAAKQDTTYAAAKIVEKAPTETAAPATVKDAAPAGGDADAGAKLFKAKCVPCHGSEGKGTAMAPAFRGNEWIKGAQNSDIAKVIKEGRAGASKRYKNFAVPMPATKGVIDGEVNALVAYIRTIN